MPAESEELSRLRSLDTRTLADLHDRMFPELYRYARYRLGDPHLAEDAASEAFVRLLEAVRSGRGPRTSLRGWLFGTLRHLVDDHFRSSHTRRGGPLRDETADGRSGPLETIEAQERRQRVRQALERLTAEQQDVLALRFGAGCNLEETALIMGRNSNAVKALQFRALQTLRRSLADKDL